MFEVGIRDIIGKMNQEELKSDTEGFTKKSQKYIEYKLEPLGLIIHSSGIKNIEYLDEEFERKRRETKNRQMEEEIKRTEELKIKLSNKIRDLARESEKKEKRHQAEMKLEDMKQEFQYKRESRIKEEESKKDIQIKKHELQTMIEEHRIKISNLNKKRFDAEEGLLEKEEESTLKRQLIEKRSKANAEKLIAIIHAETAHIEQDSNVAIKHHKAQLQRDIELMQAYTRYESLEAEANGQEKLIQAMNQANNGAILQNLVRQNPELIENTLEKLLGKNGFSSIAEGITKHLGNIDSIRIAELGGSSSENGGIEKFAELPPKILVKLLAGMNALDLGVIAEKFGLTGETFDNLLSKTKNKYEEKNIKKKKLSEVSKENLS